jgi:hypothetical protein
MRASSSTRSKLTTLVNCSTHCDRKNKKEGTRARATTYLYESIEFYDLKSKIKSIEVNQYGNFGILVQILTLFAILLCSFCFLSLLSSSYSLYLSLQWKIGLDQAFAKSDTDKSYLPKSVPLHQILNFLHRLLLQSIHLYIQDTNINVPMRYLPFVGSVWPIFTSKFIVSNFACETNVGFKPLKLYFSHV